MKTVKKQTKSRIIQNSGENPQSSQKSKQSYGICHRCNSSIEIPGLEAFKCSGGCGWVNRKLFTYTADLRTQAGGEV